MCKCGYASDGSVREANFKMKLHNKVCSDGVGEKVTFPSFQSVAGGNIFENRKKNKTKIETSLMTLEENDVFITPSLVDMTEFTNRRI